MINIARVHAIERKQDNNVAGTNVAIFLLEELIAEFMSVAAESGEQGVGVWCTHHLPTSLKLCSWRQCRDRVSQGSL